MKKQIKTACIKYTNCGETIREYDKNGNEIHYKNNNGYENWKTYDENNNQISSKDNKGNETVRKFDDQSRLLEIKKFDTNGKLIEHSILEWDENGDMIHRRDEVSKFERWYDFIEINGKHLITRMEDSSGYKLISEYNDNGDIIHEENTRGDGFTCEYTYYE